MANYYDDEEELDQEPAAITPASMPEASGYTMNPQLAEYLMKQVEANRTETEKKTKEAERELEEKANLRSFADTLASASSKMGSVRGEETGEPIALMQQTKEMNAADMAKMNRFTTGEDLRNKLYAQLAGRMGTMAMKPMHPAKPMAPNEIANLGKQKDALRAVDDLSNEWENKASGIWSKISPDIPLLPVEAKQYVDKRDMVANKVAAALSPSGRANPAMVEYYKRMLPEPGMNKERKDAKIAALKEEIQSGYKSKLDAFKSAGYDVSGYQNDIAIAGGSAPKPAGKPGEAIAETKLSQNPNIQKYADDHKIDYQTAEFILKKRGHK